MPYLAGNRLIMIGYKMIIHADLASNLLIKIGYRMERSCESTIMLADSNRTVTHRITLVACALWNVSNVRKVSIW